MPVDPELLAKLLDVVPTGVVVMELIEPGGSDDLRLVFANRAAERLTERVLVGREGENLPGALLSKVRDVLDQRVSAQQNQAEVDS